MRILIITLFLTLASCIPASSEYKISGKIVNFDEESGVAMDNNNTISKTKVEFGKPEQELACKDSGTILRYVVDEQGKAYGLLGKGNTGKTTHAVFFYFDKDGNYVAQGDEAKAKCN